MNLQCTDLSDAWFQDLKMSLNYVAKIGTINYRKYRKISMNVKYLISSISEEVILAEERTTQEERNHIMEARKRAANKRRKLKSMGKSKSTETDDDDEDADEGKKAC